MIEQLAYYTILGCFLFCVLYLPIGAIYYGIKSKLTTKEVTK